MEIKHKHTGQRGMFYISSEDDTVLAEIIYSMQGENSMILEHTEVDEELKGQNIGYQLVSAAANYARTHGLKLVPVCPFANSVINKKPEFKDLLAS